LSNTGGPEKLNSDHVRANFLSLPVKDLAKSASI